MISCVRDALNVQTCTLAGACTTARAPMPSRPSHVRALLALKGRSVRSTSMNARQDPASSVLQNATTARIAGRASAKVGSVGSGANTCRRALRCRASTGRRATTEAWTLRGCSQMGTSADAQARGSTCIAVTVVRFTRRATEIRAREMTRGRGATTTKRATD